MSTTTATPVRRKPATIGIVTAGRIAGVGRSVAYEQARTGEFAGCPVIRIGQRLRIATAPFEAVLGVDVLDYLTDDELDPTND